MIKKKRLGVKLAIWLSTTKSQESIRFLSVEPACKYHWKAFNKGYNFYLDLIAIEGLHAKLWAPKIAGVLVVEILGLSLGSPGTKCHLDVAPMERCKVYYKGEGGGFPQIQVMVSLVSLNCPWLVLTPKVLQLCTNHLVLVLCKFVWIVEACQFVLVPSRSFDTPFYPPKVLQARERAPTLYSSIVLLLLSFKKIL
jgi:hypothetical protein